MDRIGLIVTAVGIAGSLLALASVFMVWVEYDALGSLVNGTVTGWDALTDDRWAELEDGFTEKDYHLIPGLLLALSGVSAVMFIAGYSVRSRAAGIAADVVPILFGIALIVGIDRFLNQMGTYYFTIIGVNIAVNIAPGVGASVALAASVVVILASVVSIARITLSFREGGDVPGQGSM